MLSVGCGGVFADEQRIPDVRDGPAVRQQAEHLGLTTGELVFGGKTGDSLRQLVSAATSFFAFSSLVVTDGVPQIGKRAGGSQSARSTEAGQDSREKPFTRHHLESGIFAFCLVSDR